MSVRTICKLSVVAGFAASALIEPRVVGAQGVSEDRLAELIKAAAVRVPSVAVQANPRFELTLDDAVERALERNLDIALERLNPQVRDFDVSQVYAAYRPTFSTDFGLASRTNPQTSQLDGGERGVDEPATKGIVTDTSNWSAALSQAVPWGGGSYEMSWNNTRNETTNVFSSFNPSLRSNFLASYTQPLLRGFKTDPTRRQLQVSRITREISDVDLRQTITNTVAAVRQGYWDLAYATAAVDVQRQALQLAERLVQDNRARVEIGTLAPIEVIQAQSEAAARQETLAQAEQTLRTAELALKRLIVEGTADELWNAQIVPIDRPTFNPEPINIEGAIRTAMDQHTDPARTRHQLEINNVSLTSFRGDTLPALDFVGSYQLQGQGGDQIQQVGLGGPTVNVIPGGWSDAINQLVDARFPVWTVGFELSYPIGQSAAQAQYARAQVQARQTQAQLRQLELQIATEVTNAALQVDSILKRIDASRVARELAEQQLDAEQSKFEVGMSTNFFVVQAQRDLVIAQDNELRAILDYQKALIDFERAQQSSLSGFGITVLGGGD